MGCLLIGCSFRKCVGKQTSNAELELGNRGSELLFQFYLRDGVQIQPLVANSSAADFAIFVLHKCFLAATAAALSKDRSLAPRRCGRFYISPSRPAERKRKHRKHLHRRCVLAASEKWREIEAHMPLLGATLLSGQSP